MSCDVKMFSNFCAKKVTIDEKNYFFVDECLVGEVLALNAQGIKTTECCCGHEIMNPVLFVERGHENKMKKLGYSWDEPVGDGSESFHPKSKIKKEDG